MEMDGDYESPEFVVVNCYNGQCDLGMAHIGTSTVEWIHFEDWTTPPERVDYLDIDGDGLLDALIQSGTGVIAVGWTPGASVPDAGNWASAPLQASSAPNPSGGRCQLSFSVAQAGPVSVTIYDPAGRRVRDLLSGSLPAGFYGPAWDGRDDFGNSVLSGVYFARIDAVDGERSVKLVLTR
jgi:hypothetical protein